MLAKAAQRLVDGAHRAGLAQAPVVTSTQYAEAAVPPDPDENAADSSQAKRPSSAAVEEAPRIWLGPEEGR